MGDIFISYNTTELILYGYKFIPCNFYVLMMHDHVFSCARMVACMHACMDGCSIMMNKIMNMMMEGIEMY